NVQQTYTYEVFSGLGEELGRGKPFCRRTHHRPLSIACAEPCDRPAEITGAAGGSSEIPGKPGHHIRQGFSAEKNRAGSAKIEFIGNLSPLNHSLMRRQRGGWCEQSELAQLLHFFAELPQSALQETSNGVAGATHVGGNFVER